MASGLADMPPSERLRCAPRARWLRHSLGGTSALPLLRRNTVDRSRDAARVGVRRPAAIAVDTDALMRLSDPINNDRREMEPRDLCDGWCFAKTLPGVARRTALGARAVYTVAAPCLFKGPVGRGHRGLYIESLSRERAFRAPDSEATRWRGPHGPVPRANFRPAPTQCAQRQSGQNPEGSARLECDSKQQAIRAPEAAPSYVGRPEPALHRAPWWSS